MSLLQQKCAHLLEKFPINEELRNDDLLFFMLFSNQITLMTKKLNHKAPEDLTTKERSDLIRQQLEYLNHEESELRELLPWKGHKQYPDNFEIDIEEARFEVADMFCFLINIARALNMSPFDLFKYTYTKQLQNLERQTNPEHGYIK
jgi:hypothetical protein